MRKVIQISDGKYLCNDGTMCEKTVVDTADSDGHNSIWLQLDDVPQPEAPEVPTPNGRLQTHEILRGKLWLGM